MTTGARPSSSAAVIRLYFLSPVWIYAAWAFSRASPQNARANTPWRAPPTQASKRANVRLHGQQQREGLERTVKCSVAAAAARSLVTCGEYPNVSTHPSPPLVIPPHRRPLPLLPSLQVCPA
eukprot:scaffold65454_cov31-Tisochrysis_lutea.AAC.2